MANRNVPVETDRQRRLRRLAFRLQESQRAGQTPPFASKPDETLAFRQREQFQYGPPGGRTGFQPDPPRFDLDRFKQGFALEEGADAIRQGLGAVGGFLGGVAGKIGDLPAVEFLIQPGQTLGGAAGELLEGAGRNVFDPISGTYVFPTTPQIRPTEPGELAGLSTAQEAAARKSGELPPEPGTVWFESDTKIVQDMREGKLSIRDAHAILSERGRSLDQGARLLGDEFNPLYWIGPAEIATGARLTKTALAYISKKTAPALRRGAGAVAERGAEALTRLPTQEARAGGDVLPTGGPPTRQPPGPPEAPIIPDLPTEPPIIPGGASRRRIVPELPEFFDQIRTVQPGGRVARILGRAGVDPSAAATTPTRRASVAHARQLIVGEEQVNTALAQYDAIVAEEGRVARILGRTRLGIDRNGFVEGTGKRWEDVASNPSAFPGLTDRQRAAFRFIAEAVEDVESEARLAGLTRNATLKNPNEFYIPRKVKGVRGVELHRPSNPNLQRMYDEATEGAARGIDYGADPRATLELHLRTRKSQIAENQLSDFVSQFAVKPSELVPAPIRTQLQDALRILRATKSQARRDLKEAQRKLARPAATPRQVAARKADLAEMERLRDVTNPQRIDGARTAYDNAKRAYSQKLKAIRKSEVAKGTLFGRDGDISVKLWKSKFLPADLFDDLQQGLKGFGREGAGPVTRGALKLTNTIRTGAAVGDFGAPLIHGLTTLWRHPLIWAKSTSLHYLAFIDPTVQMRYIGDHIDTFNRMEAQGLSIGDNEIYAGARAGQGISIGSITKPLPKGEQVRGIFQSVGRQTFGRFQASFNTFLAIARAELFESMVKVGFSDAEAARVIRNMTGGLDSRALGVGPNQRALESMFLGFSPKLFRSTVALVGNARELHTRTGRESARIIAQWAAGNTGLYIAAGIMLGKTEAEIEKGLNPLNGLEYGRHEINGDWIGVGGQLRALSQLTAALIATGSNNPAALKELHRFEGNPLIKYWMNRGAVGTDVALAALEALSGANVHPYARIEDTSDLVQHLFTRAIPFTIQGQLEGEKPLTGLFSLGGFSTFPGREPERVPGRTAPARPLAPSRELPPSDYTGGSRMEQMREAVRAGRAGR